MKKVLLISLIAMMLIGMLLTAACKAKEAPVTEETVVDSVQTEAPVVADTTVAAPAATTPAPVTK
ncbi:MAG TPA: hypothetical protein P5533_02610 [Candidatus Cloacimonadota bacterium]|nr:hypothetical protein [Candidatus Cloacimonadota bacterium]